MPTIQNRRATDAQWTSENPILAAGEVGYEINTNKHKIGNGFATWSELRYFIDEAEVEALIAASGGGSGGGAPIDDGVIATDKLWSSTKTSAELKGKADDMFIVLSAEGLPINPVNGEVVELDTSDPTKYGLQMGVGIIYGLAIGAQPKYVETQYLIPGAITIGLSERRHGLCNNPEDVGLNQIGIVSVHLDTPSSSGVVEFSMAMLSSGSTGESGALFQIPAGETEVLYPEPGYGIRPEYGVGQTGDVLVVRIHQAGTGASGFKVRGFRYT